MSKIRALSQQLGLSVVMGELSGMFFKAVLKKGKLWQSSVWGSWCVLFMVFL